MRYKCIACSEETFNEKFCNNSCQGVFRSIEAKKKLLSGEFVGRIMSFGSKEWARPILIDLLGYACSSCGIDEWQGQKLVLEVDHIDGDAKNNVIENLRFLCPNCHSLTPTHRNKGARVSARRASRKGT